MYKRTVIFLLVKFILFVLINGQKNLNDECQLARSGSIGICRFLQDCPIVLNEIIQHSLYPTECGFESRKQIVCCPLPPTKKPTTKSPQSDRISAKKCAEYRNAVYDENKVFRCPISSVPLVFGGVDAFPKEFPHMALIGFEENSTNTVTWGCGGTLISDNFILTAAHCMFERNFGYAKYVLVGDLDYGNDTDDAQPQQYNVIERIRHPDFKHPSKYNDIALLRIDGPVNFNQYIRPACLPQSNSTDTQRVLASGWGKTNYYKPSTQHLQKVILELFPHQECNASYANDISRRLRFGIIDETQICAGSHTSQKDTCQGDSGGPIQVYHSSLSCMYTVVGITSFGKMCGTIGTPGVYTRIYPYLNWIESIVWLNAQT